MRIRAFSTEFSNTLSLQMTYRLNFFVAYLLRAVQLLIALIVWRALFDQESIIGGYTWNSLASYLILVSTLTLLLYPSHMFSIYPLIHKGTLGPLLLRPCNFEMLSLSRFFGTKIPTLIGSVAFGLIMCLALAVSPAIHISWPVLTLLLFSLVISFYLGLTIATVAFWLVEMWPLKRIFQGGMLLLGGIAAPLDLYPPIIKTIAFCTPFPYLGSIPVLALTGKIPVADLLPHLTLTIAWAALLIFSYRLLWRLGLKKFEAVGN